jgi:hypothetical protein
MTNFGAGGINSSNVLVHSAVTLRGNDAPATPLLRYFLRVLLAEYVDRPRSDGEDRDE